MENQASTPLQGQQGQQGQQGFPIFQIQIPTEEEIQEYNREKEERRQQALERLRNENRALPQETPPPLLCPSVPRSTTDSVGWESVSKKN